MKRLLGLLMAVMVMMGGMASSAETAQQEARKELLFKHQPDQIGIVTPLPDGRLFVESFVEDTETSAYHYIELFAAKRQFALRISKWIYELGRTVNL